MTSAEASDVPQPSADGLPPSVAFMLSRLGFDVSRAMGEALQDVGLELRQFGLLRMLAGSPGQSQRALGEMLRIRPNRMVALVDDLEQRGLIERRPHPEDRRAYAVVLTADGEALLAEAFQAAFTVEADTCAPLEPAEREQLLALLRKLVLARTDGETSPAGVHPGMLLPDEH